MYISVNGSRIAGVKLFCIFYHLNGIFIFHYFVQYTLEMDHLRFCSKRKCVTCRHAEVCILTNKSAGTDKHVCLLYCV